MTSTHALRLVALAGLGTLMATPSFAQDSYFYGGLSVGTSRAKFHEEAIVTRQLPAGVSSTAVGMDDRETAYKLFGGYQANRYLGFEAGYFSLGKFSTRATTTGGGTLDGTMNFKGINGDVVGTLPITENLAAIGRVGVQIARNRSAYTATGFTPNDPAPNNRNTNYKVGAGLQYAFSPSVLGRTEIERYRVNDGPGSRGIVNTWSVGLVFPFGRAPQATKTAMVVPYVAPYVAPEHAPVVVVPMREPVVAQAPPPVIVELAPPAAAVVVPERRRVSYSAESMFGFDQSAVQPEGKAQLDTFSNELKGARFETVTVEGHTDRLGSTAYNQKLSMERAEAVKAYLVAPGGVDAAKISTVGKSESNPVTKAEDCKGMKATTQLRACLQPDRRVEIEVTGTKP
jgi:OOP family OmpA-OmpF porin